MSRPQGFTKTYQIAIPESFRWTEPHEIDADWRKNTGPPVEDIPLVELDVEIDFGLDFHGSPQEEARDIAARIGDVAVVIGGLQQELERVDSRFIAWRSKFGSELRQQDEKLAEWKVDQEIRKQAAYLRYHTNLGIIRGELESLRALLSALHLKGKMITSMHIDGTREVATAGLAGMEE